MMSWRTRARFVRAAATVAVGVSQSLLRTVLSVPEAPVASEGLRFSGPPSSIPSDHIAAKIARSGRNLFGAEPRWIFLREVL
jgi:hypothetical protein